VRLIRVAGCLALVAGLAVASGRASTTSAGYPSAAPCTAAALSSAFPGPLTVRSVQNYGCEGQWAFLWATIGPVAHEIGVTELLRYSDRNARWSAVSRGRYCTPTVLPTYVYRLACFSN
jgi:hypothetical protein